MSEKRARELRRVMYGDMAHKTQYRKNNGVIYADSLRQRYQMAKGRKAHMPIMTEEK